MLISDIKPSPAFKTQTTKAILAIGFFILTYLFILVLAVALTALCVYGAVMLVIASPGLWTIILGFGLVSLGILVLIFLLKFLLKSHKVDRSHLIEITAEEEPELFELIDAIVVEVGTSFPKKVYLSTDVNAAVFYDSNFWSMFFPIRKNLQIGLGLMNTVSKAELKAVLAHEFGHFSQKTMKVGSYVYNVNQVIHNLLYDNDSFGDLAQDWAEVSDYIAIFVAIAVKIIQGIQWILRKLYDVVNKSYMGLSREMEFHADEIAAHVTGFEPLKTALLRLNLADHALSNVLNFYEGKIAEQLKSENIYKEQFFVMNFLATDSNIPVVNNLPAVTVGELNKLNKSKLVIKNQWASHPSTAERVERLEATNIHAQNPDVQPANTLMRNIKTTQEQYTDKMFSELETKDKFSEIPFERFQTEFQVNYKMNCFAEVYNGYYDDKNPIYTPEQETQKEEATLGFEDLFADSKVDNIYLALALQSDLETLNHIDQKMIPVKTFDYDGQKYARKDAKSLMIQLSQELEQVKEQIDQNDRRIFQFFHQLDQQQTNSSQLTELYQAFYDYDQVYDVKNEDYIKLQMALQFINDTTPIEDIKTNFSNIKPLEAVLKINIQELLADPRYQSEITPAMKENFELYLSKDWTYFGNLKYFDNHLEILFTAMQHYAYLLSKGYFLLKKELLDYQVGLLEGI